MGDARLAGQGVARSTRALLDEDVGPVLVGLRTLEWRWEKLAGIGVDPDEMLAGLADRAATAAKVTREVGGADAVVAADALHSLVVAITRGDVATGRRAAALTRAVALAADLHRLLETRWRDLVRQRVATNATSGSANARP